MDISEKVGRIDYHITTLYFICRSSNYDEELTQASQIWYLIAGFKLVFGTVCINIIVSF